MSSMIVRGHLSRRSRHAGRALSGIAVAFWLAGVAGSQAQQDYEIHFGGTYTYDVLIPKGFLGTNALPGGTDVYARRHLERRCDFWQAYDELIQPIPTSLLKVDLNPDAVSIATSGGKNLRVVNSSDGTPQPAPPPAKAQVTEDWLASMETKVSELVEQKWKPYMQSTFVLSRRARLDFERAGYGAEKDELGRVIEHIDILRGNLIEMRKYLHSQFGDFKQVRSTNVVVKGIRSSYGLSVQQKIAYVSGGDLWAMNEDGSGAVRLITAPSGRRIGRSVFSPDGRKIVYEVWTTGGDRFPEISDLWVADGDGGNAQLLCAAGSLTDATGKSPYVYTARVLWGPSFSPDGTQVSCWRIQTYKSPDGSLSLLEREIGVIDLSGGLFTSLWKTREMIGQGLLNNPNNPFQETWDWMIGLNTVWTPDHRIVFPRSGKTAVSFTAIADCSNTNRTAWPCRLYVRWVTEDGRAPVSVRVKLGSTTVDLGGAFKGYGNLKLIGMAANWSAFSSPDWQTPQMGAWYGPVDSADLAAGHYPVTVEVNDGTWTASLYYTNGLDLTAGAVDTVDRSTTWFERSPHSSISAISPSGGTPTRLFRTAVDSIAWNREGTLFGADYTGYGHFNVVGFSAYNGMAFGSVRVGTNQPEGYVGNWDVADQRVTAWSGAGGVGSMKILDLLDEVILDLGAGEFPAFMNSYRTDVSVTEGQVTVTDRAGNHPQVCVAGQRVIADDLIALGAPSVAAVVPGPILTNVVPGWNASVGTNASLSVRFQFNQAINTNDMRERYLSMVSWPWSDDFSDSGWALNWSQCGMQMLDAAAASRGWYNGTLEEAESSGVARGTWNTERTEYTLVFTNREFAGLAGRCCDIRLNLSGLQGAGGAGFDYGIAATRYRLVESIGPAGGTVRSLAGATVTVPAGVVGSPATFQISAAKSIPAGSTAPVTGGWEQVSDCYWVTPTGQVLAGSITVGIPVIQGYPGAVVWRYTGSIWTNLGGAWNSTSGVLSAQTTGLGAFCVFYPVSGAPKLTVVKTADRKSAVPNDRVMFNFFVENFGTGTVTNLTLTDVVPSSLIVETNSLRPAGGAYVPATRTLTWPLGNLGSRSNAWASFEARLKEDLSPGLVITNIATVSGLFGSTTSPPCRITLAGTATPSPRLGAGGTNSTAWAQMAALESRIRRSYAALSTSQTQNTNLINFTAFDSVVQSNQAVGLRTYAVMDAVATGGLWPTPSDFARAFALWIERYDGDAVADMPGLLYPVKVWELLDTYDDQAVRWTNFPVSLYGQYLAAAYAAGHAADPTMTLLPSAVTASMDSGSQPYFPRLLEAVPGIVGAMDALSFRAGWDATPVQQGTRAGDLQYLMADDILEQMRLAEVSDREVWISSADFMETYVYLAEELGYTCSATDCAVFVSRSIPYALAAGIDHILYTDVEAKPGDLPARAWAMLVDAAGNRRMAFYTFRKIAQKIEGFSSARLSFPGEGRIVAEFGVSNQPVWILWSSSNTLVQVALPVGPVPQVRITETLPQTYNNTSATWGVITQAVVNGVAGLEVGGAAVIVEPLGIIDPDIDGDGIPNDQDTDIDGDSLPNDWELAQALNPYVADENEDADGDGFSNAGEYWAGTDPQDAESVLRVNAVQRGGATVGLDWSAVSGRLYRVAWNSSVTGHWTHTLDGPCCATGSIMRWTDAGPPRTPREPQAETQRYYRILVEPLPE